VRGIWRVREWNTEAGTVVPSGQAARSAVQSASVRWNGSPPSGQVASTAAGGQLGQVRQIPVAAGHLPGHGLDQTGQPASPLGERALVQRFTGSGVQAAERRRGRARHPHRLTLTQLDLPPHPTPPPRPRPANW
jgi:hypothetical protein